MKAEELAAIRQRYDLMRTLAGYAKAVDTVPELSDLAVRFTPEVVHDTLAVTNQLMTDDLPALLAEVDQLRTQDAVTLTTEEHVELAALLQEMRDLVWLGGGFPPDERVGYFIGRLTVSSGKGGTR